MNGKGKLKANENSNIIIRAKGRVFYSPQEYFNFLKQSEGNGKKANAEDEGGLSDGSN